MYEPVIINLPSLATEFMMRPCKICWDARYVPQYHFNQSCAIQSHQFDVRSIRRTQF